MLPLICCALAFSQPDRLEVPIGHRRPSHVLKILTEGSLLPASLKASANDSKGILILEGNRGDAEELQRYISLFDVEWMTVKLNLRLIRRSEELDASFLSTVRTNTPFAFSDERSAADGTMTGRINGDGTVTVSLKIDKPGNSVARVVRIPIGMDYCIALPNSEAERFRAYASPPWNDPKKASQLFLLFRVDVISNAFEQGQRPP